MILLTEQHIQALYNWNIEEKHFECYTCRPFKLCQSFEEYACKTLKAILCWPNLLKPPLRIMK